MRCRVAKLLCHCAQQYCHQLRFWKCSRLFAESINKPSSVFGPRPTDQTVIVGKTFREGTHQRFTVIIRKKKTQQRFQITPQRHERKRGGGDTRDANSKPGKEKPVFGHWKQVFWRRQCSQKLIFEYSRWQQNNGIFYYLTCCWPCLGIVCREITKENNVQNSKQGLTAASSNHFFFCHS